MGSETDLIFGAVHVWLLIRNPQLPDIGPFSYSILFNYDVSMKVILEQHNV